jgi:hypothetical protein
MSIQRCDAAAVIHHEEASAPDEKRMEHATRYAWKPDMHGVHKTMLQSIVQTFAASRSMCNTKKTHSSPLGANTANCLT